MHTADYAYGFSQGLNGLPQPPAASHNQVRGWLHGQEFRSRFAAEGLELAKNETIGIGSLLMALSAFASELRSMREQMATLNQILQEMDEDAPGLSLDGRSLPGERDQRESL